MTTYIQNGDVGLAKWRTAYAQFRAGTKPILNVLCIGDSNVEGYNSQGANGAVLDQELIYLTGWLGLMRTNFADRFGDVGFGLMPLWETTTPPYYVCDAGTKTVSFSGTWVPEPGFGFGPYSLYTTTQNSSVTIPFDGTGIVIYWLQQSAGGTFTWALDGGSATQVNTNGTEAIGTTTISSLTDTMHTLVIKKDQNDAAEFWPLGVVEQKGTRGIRMHMGALGGQSTVAYTEAMTAPAVREPFAHMDAPDLILIAYHANDSPWCSAADYKSYTETLITYFQSTFPNASIALACWGIMAPPVQIDYDYDAAYEDLATTYNCAVLAWNQYWNYNYDAEVAADMVSPANETTHFRYSGHRLIAQWLENALVSNVYSDTVGEKPIQNMSPNGTTPIYMPASVCGHTQVPPPDTFTNTGNEIIMLTSYSENCSFHNISVSGGRNTENYSLVLRPDRATILGPYSVEAYGTTPSIVYDNMNVNIAIIRNPNPW